MKTDGRLQTLAFDISLDNGEHRLSVSIGFDTPAGQPIESGRPVEIAFTGRGKIGQGMDLLLQELGLKLSRVLQHRHPETGAELKGP